MEEVLVRAICNILGVHPSEIKPETDFVGDLGADSLDLYQIIMYVEEELGIEVDAESLAKVSTYGEALEFLLENE